MRTLRIILLIALGLFAAARQTRGTTLLAPQEEFAVSIDRDVLGDFDLDLAYGLLTATTSSPAGETTGASLLSNTDVGDNSAPGTTANTSSDRNVATAGLSSVSSAGFVFTGVVSAIFLVCLLAFIGYRRTVSDL